MQAMLSIAEGRQPPLLPDIASACWSRKACEGNATPGTPMMAFPGMVGLKINWQLLGRMTSKSRSRHAAVFSLQLKGMQCVSQSLSIIEIDREWQQAICHTTPQQR